MSEDDFSTNQAMVRIFGDYDSYQKSLPDRLWERLESGKWASEAR